MRKVIITRGIQGSGKSTYLRNHHPNATICSADNYFLEVLGNGQRYVFDVRKLGDAHKWCMQKFIKALQEDVEEVAVDNTSIALWEFSPYVAVANAFDYDVQIIRLEADPKICAQRNIHKVSEKTILSMSRRIESVPKWWKETVVKN